MLVRCNAVWALGEIGSPPALAAIIKALQDSNEQVRVLAITALTNLKGSQASDSLADMLKDNSIAVRREASAALVKIGSGACSSVAPLLSDADVQTRETAALIMRWISDRSAVPALLKALNDESAYVRNQAARTLGRLRDKASVESLRGLLNDPEDDIRNTAEISLKKMGVTFD